MNNKKVAILIVDDETELLDIYREFFEMNNFNVFIASHPTEAMEIYKNNQNIQLIISDANMGRISGLKFLEMLKSTYSTIPLFYLVTGEGEIREEDVKALGVDRLISKPFDCNAICPIIRKDLDLSL